MRPAPAIGQFCFGTGGINNQGLAVNDCYVIRGGSVEPLWSSASTVWPYSERLGRWPRSWEPAKSLPKMGPIPMRPTPQMALMPDTTDEGDSIDATGTADGADAGYTDGADTDATDAQRHGWAMQGRRRLRQR